MEQFQVYPIGTIHTSDEGAFIKLTPRYIDALQGLEGFSHIQVIWWCNHCDNQEARNTLVTPQPYKKSPEVMGIFATRSPARPNPIALTPVEVIHIDYASGVIQIAYIDADDNTPVLDIKPYTPSLDRLQSPSVPTWCSHWPDSLEGSASFDWEKEFNF